MTGSVLEAIPGLGPTRRRRLLDTYGTLKELREATREDLVSLAWLPDAVAHSLFEHLHDQVPDTPINAADGVDDGQDY